MMLFKANIIWHKQELNSNNIRGKKEIFGIIYAEKKVEKNSLFLLKIHCIIRCLYFIELAIVIHRNCGKLSKALKVWITLYIRSNML